MLTSKRNSFKASATDSEHEVIFLTRENVMAVISSWRFLNSSSNSSFRVSSSSKHNYKSVNLFSSSADSSPQIRCMIYSRVSWPDKDAGEYTEPVRDVPWEALREPAGGLLITDRFSLNRASVCQL